MVNRLPNRKLDTDRFAGLNILACFTASPELSGICPQTVAKRNALFPGTQAGACAGTEEVSPFKHPSHQHAWLWQNPSDLATAKVTASVFQSPTIAKGPSESGWTRRPGAVKVLNQDSSQSKRLVPTSQKHLFSNVASPPFPSQMHSSSNSLAKIWEAYKDSPAAPHWETFPGEGPSPGSWNPGRELREWRNRGPPLEDIHNLSQHKLRNLGIKFLGSKEAAADCRGKIWEHQDDPLEGGDVGLKLYDRHNHSKPPAETQDLSFRGTELAAEQSPIGSHAVRPPPSTSPCPSFKGKVNVFPELYDGLYHPSEHRSLSISPLQLTRKGAGDRWGKFYPRDWDKKCLLPQGCEMSKENAVHYSTQPHQPQASEKAAQGSHAAVERWPYPVLEAGYMSVKGTSELGEKASASKPYLDWKETDSHLPVSLDHPQLKAWPIPLSFYYPPSDILEWDDSPMPSWCGVPQSHTWESTSPEPWVFPRMKLY
ncbi:uncharacterized protein LOC144674181 [Cetorhinus maximus]